jgi:hypothetical protein
MEFKIEAGTQLTRKFLTAIMPSMIEQLGLQKSKKAVVIRVADECDGLGMTVPIDILNSYIVVIKPGPVSRIGLTLAHEMVHVRQMAKGFLKTNKNGSAIWCGKKYSKKTKYLEQPWELDAFARQEIIFRKAIE